MLGLQKPELFDYQEQEKDYHPVGVEEILPPLSAPYGASRSEISREHLEAERSQRRSTGSAIEAIEQRAVFLGGLKSKFFRGCNSPGNGQSEGV